MKRAISHLEDAEAALMTFIHRLSEMPEDAPDEEVPDALPVILAVMRSIGRAAGVIEANEDKL